MATSDHVSRREMLRRSGMGMGALALGGLLDDDRSHLGPGGPHFAPRARRVIHVFANGGPSHVDTFDPKPAIARHAGKPMPTGNLKTERKTGGLMPSPFRFRRRGQSGVEISELFEHVGRLEAEDVLRELGEVGEQVVDPARCAPHDRLDVDARRVAPQLGDDQHKKTDQESHHQQRVIAGKFEISVHECSLGGRRPARVVAKGALYQTAES